MVDYQAIKSRITVEMVIDALGIRITKQDNPDQLRAKCPHCKASGDRMLSMNTEKNLFTCFANKPNARGDVIALTAHVRGTGQKEAAEWLEVQFPQQREGIPRATRDSSHVEPSRAKSRPVMQLIRTDQLKPANDDQPEPRPPGDYTDLL